MLEQALEGNSPGEHRPRRPTIPGQGRVVARTDSRGEQSFEAGVPAAESGEPGPIRERATHTSAATRHARRSSDPGEPSSRPPQSGEPQGQPWRVVGAIGERGREHLGPCRAVGRSNANPQGSRRPARAGTAPREGKALKGDSKGRERHETRPRSVGAHGDGEPRKGFVRAASAAKTVERGKNPEDGTGEGLATFTHSVEAARSRRSDKGHPASTCSREREPQERRSRAWTDAEVAQAIAARPEHGQPRRGPALKGKRTPGEDLPGPWSRGSGRKGKTPRPSRTARGERAKPRARYSGGTTKL
jgi:hypothetical protein